MNGNHDIFTRIYDGAAACAMDQPQAGIIEAATELTGISSAPTEAIICAYANPPAVVQVEYHPGNTLEATVTRAIACETGVRVEMGNVHTTEDALLADTQTRFMRALGAVQMREADGELSGVLLQIMDDRTTDFRPIPQS